MPFEKYHSYVYFARIFFVEIGKLTKYPSDADLEKELKSKDEEVNVKEKALNNLVNYPAEQNKSSWISVCEKSGNACSPEEAKKATENFSKHVSIIFFNSLGENHNYVFQKPILFCQASFWIRSIFKRRSIVMFPRVNNRKHFYKLTCFGCFHFKVLGYRIWMWKIAKKNPTRRKHKLNEDLRLHCTKRN